MALKSMSDLVTDGKTTTTLQTGDLFLLGRSPYGASDDKVIAYENMSGQIVGAFPMQARLTLTTNVPVTTSDVTAAGTLYWTPYKGNKITLFDGSGNPGVYELTQKSLSLSLTSGSVYDIFAYNNSGTPTLESLVWSSATARATALALNKGMYVKSGDNTRVYLGTILASGTNQTEDSESKRYVFNYYNRVLRKLKAKDTTNSWAYTTASYREINAGTTYGTSRVGLCIGYSEDIVSAIVTGVGTASSGNPSIAAGIGLDSATNVADINSPVVLTSVVGDAAHAWWSGYPGIGLHYLAALEYGGTNVTMYGDNGASVFQTGLVAHAWM